MLKAGTTVECPLSNSRTELPSSRDYGQDDSRRILSTVEDGLDCSSGLVLLPGLPCSVEVAIEAREVATGDLNPDPMAFPKEVAGTD